MTTKEQKPQLVRQASDLLNDLVLTWKNNGETMEFMGVEVERTFETMEYPDWERGVGFMRRKIWVPCPGPMKHFDKDGHLISEGTVDYVQTEYGRRLTHVGIMKKIFMKTENFCVMKRLNFPKKEDMPNGFVDMMVKENYNGKKRFIKTAIKKPVSILIKMAS